ncbi:EF-hand domain pair/EF-hand domain containing protein, putative [Trypanosoma equiperdum]|uniref:EF-hand domain-containing protein n=4 Tax=Trypanozoon TaxID=39700 RepID=Q581Q7_TRYB2|nr:hypothetical protein, conserved [Trypanosoma brucei gambiense DAL972]XP_844324.1 hypothetical protein, conserved [Trypanosoma brucei brucei TREU927]AAX79913.1 hypothetical protein, conserved [Trypanosoma brucei]RHW73091.1 EF-hand domain pair/EF-hand domain containing protein [Trypanosoma brucei equiperdum]SCU68065.1 EF-hand domain pair/EF-hand domain containing protein, putative [Trypanosoma equiperdum]AAZ10765.1 hypothetical protein, conserved [Trypanosoma brucei brucei TREU927]CBH10460.1|eukprot:XP_011772750.1 hypothetical protein, conserved [Trypanosoma brucei gambiense DAL972]
MPLLYASRAKHTRFKSIVQRTRRLLCNGASGANGIRKLSRGCGIAVDSGGQSMEKAKFVEALEESGVSLDSEDIEAIVHVLDRSGDGVLDPTDFIAALRRNLTPLKLTWITRVWYTFTQSKDGSVYIDEVLSSYNAAGHPDVVQNIRSEQGVRSEFEAAFSTTTNPDGAITRQEFEQYCSGVAALCANDLEFLTLMRGVWPASVRTPLDEETMRTHREQNPCNMTFSSYQTAAEKGAVTDVRTTVAVVDDIILSSHRPVVIQSPLAVRQLSIALRRQDVQRNFFLSRETFLEVLRGHRLYLKDPESALTVLDTAGDGSVDYLLYMNLLLPPLPPARLMMLERLWELFPKDTCGTADVIELHKRFSAEDGEEQDAFLTAWDVRQALYRRFTFEEIVEWHTPLSAMFELDNDFETMLKKRWDFS